MSRIGVISDTHDHLDNVRKAVALFNQLKPDRVVHCGDVIAPFVLKELSGLRMPVVAVYGNCDGDRVALRQRAEEFGFVLQNGPHGFGLGGKRVVVSHQPLSPAPDCDFYLHGHTHKLRHEGKRPVIVNPGEACGWLSGRATVAMLDTETAEVEFLDLQVEELSLPSVEAQAAGLAPGLYVVSTPIGNLGDMTYRAVEVLRTVDMIACEDTRHSGLLLQHYHIRSRLTSYHEYNKVSRTPELLQQLQQGRRIAIITDAGTPGISDPGFYLIRAAVHAGITVTPVPGASALLAGLVVSGLPSDRFAFEGFLPKRDGRRRKRLAALKGEERTTVYCESARRVKRLLEEMLELWGDRDVVVCRELTKRFEEILRGKMTSVLEQIGDRELKGETVVVVAGPGEENPDSEVDDHEDTKTE